MYTCTKHLPERTQIRNSQHFLHHTYVEAIIYIDAREFRKHNKKIVWLVVFMPFYLRTSSIFISIWCSVFHCIWCVVFALAAHTQTQQQQQQQHIEHMNCHKYVVTKASSTLFCACSSCFFLTNKTLTSVQFVCECHQHLHLATHKTTSIYMYI